MFGSSKYKLHHRDGYDFLKVSDSENPDKNLVFVHGMFGGLSNFDSLIECLDGYSIFVPKIPLYELKKTELSIPSLAGWLNGFMDTIGIEQAIFLGNSMGGHVVLEFANQFPEKVSAMVLTGSSGLLEYDFGSSFPKRKSYEYIKERANMTFYEDLADDVIVNEILDVVNSRSKLLSLLKLTRSTHSHNMEERLPQIKQPVLLVWGKQDVVTPPKVANQFKKLLPNAQLKWIDQCGHAPMMERPDQFSSLLKEFLSGLEQQSKSSKKIT
jgi:pimeloyl-ACP methyl ester carboxylesterase